MRYDIVKTDYIKNHCDSKIGENNYNLMFFVKPSLELNILYNNSISKIVKANLVNKKDEIIFSKSFLIDKSNTSKHFILILQETALKNTINSNQEIIEKDLYKQIII